MNRGLVQVFGNQYTLERGDIRFLNPVKIEPTIDMDLSSRARGVTVNISLPGRTLRPQAELQLDPPLQSSEVSRCSLWVATPRPRPVRQRRVPVPALQAA